MLALVCIGASSCSIQRFQREGDVLYLGVKDIRVEKQDETNRFADKALEAAEGSLAYAPNNAIFGSSTLRWPLPLYGPYLHLKYADRSTGIRRLLHRLGSKPVWLRDVNPKLRAEVAQKILAEHGYLGARVSSAVHYGKDSLTAKISYALEPGQLYLLDSVQHLTNSLPLGDSTYYIHSDESCLQRGTVFSLDNLIKDRTQMASKLREEGYHYFNAGYVSYEADTLQERGKVQLRAVFSAGTPKQSLSKWKIGQVRVRFRENDETSSGLPSDTLTLADGVVSYFEGEIPIRPKILNGRIRLRPDSLYRYRQEDLTLKSLASIGSFAGTEIIYTPRDTSALVKGGEGVMDMNILMTKDKPWSVTLGGQFVHKSTDFIGPGAVLTLNRRNVFHGGESFSLNLSGSYEWQKGQNPFSSASSSLKSYQFALDASLSFPTLLIPGIFNAYYAYPTTTTLRLSGQHLNRAGYYGLSTLGIALSYDFQPNERLTHSIAPLNIDYTHLSRVTSVFATIMRDNPSLALSLSNQLIPAIGYTVTYKRLVGKDARHTLWWRNSIKEAGNIIKASSLLVGNKWSDTQTILGVPYAEFIRASSELRYTHYIDRYQSLATRVMLGAIYSYGNMRKAPYVEQFYVGGASSIRAFNVRSLGPGGFQPKASGSLYAFMDHVGEAKFEMNAEFRRKVTQSLELALFLDAGNIWLLRSDADRQGGSLSEIKGVADFLDKLAVGTGLGLRYDFGYLMIRLDAGIGLHLPYATSRRGWYNIPKFFDAFALHLAIGYPF